MFYLWFLHLKQLDSMILYGRTCQTSNHETNQIVMISDYQTSASVEFGDKAGSVFYRLLSRTYVHLVIFFGSLKNKVIS